MGTPSFNAALYECAMNCALLRQHRRCKEYFGGIACEECRYNVKKYIDADPRRLELFMMQAESRADRLDHAAKLHRPFFVIGIVFCLLAAWVIWNGKRERQVRANEQQSVVEVSKLSHDTPYVAPVGQTDVVNTLHRVTKVMKDNTDVNGDGLSNCIDAAVTFYKFFPDKSKVIIIRNYNTTTGMNHLFNTIKIDGVWKAIEPQAFYAGKSSYFMKDVWGAQYDSSHNVDSTERYKMYAK